MITDKFTHGGHPVEIRLDSIDRSFVIYARYEGGGCLNGFEVRVDNIAGLCIDQIVDHPVIVHLRSVVKQLAGTDAWKAYEQSVLTTRNQT